MALLQQEATASPLRSVTTSTCRSSTSVAGDRTDFGSSFVTTGSSSITRSIPTATTGASSLPWSTTSTTLRHLSTGRWRDADETIRCHPRRSSSTLRTRGRRHSSSNASSLAGSTTNLYVSQHIRRLRLAPVARPAVRSASNTTKT